MNRAYGKCKMSILLPTENISKTFYTQMFFFFFLYVALHEILDIVNVLLHELQNNCSHDENLYNILRIL